MEVMGMVTGYNKLSEQRMPHREYNKIAGAPITNVGKYERIASVLLGGFLAYRALKNRKLSSFLFGLPAFSLLNRGVSGYCALYNKAGLSSTNT